MSKQAEYEATAKQWRHAPNCAWIIWIAEGKYYPNPGCTCKTTEAYQNAGVEHEIFMHAGHIPAAENAPPDTDISFRKQYAQEQKNFGHIEASPRFIDKFTVSFESGGVKTAGDFIMAHLRDERFPDMVMGLRDYHERQLKHPSVTSLKTEADHLREAIERQHLEFLEADKRVTELIIQNNHIQKDLLRARTEAKHWEETAKKIDAEHAETLAQLDSAKEGK